ncbi:MAG: biosynthetic-type acetolactate synthase large subunit, partial [Chitinispirillaceae bacterium]|nr:biosynthetic-type acetolactate synthase large subunit [Chitinispirillaceae bacterium]
MTKTKMTGAEALVKLCEQHGVTHIFGYPGGANIPVFDALLDSPIKLVLSRHEQGATHMADGFARATGRAGVALVTSGPGATNAITGIMTAQMDSVPMIVICGQTITPNLGLDAFQEADVSGISYPVVKYSYLVKNVENIPEIVKEAFHLAETGRPGPVLIDLPKDVSSTVFTPDFSVPIRLPGYTVPEFTDTKAVARAAKKLRQAKRPVILAGHGALIAHAWDQIRTLAETMNIPVVTTLLGKGVIPEDHPLCLGMLGMHGTAYANCAVRECDLILNIGSRWDDRIIGKPEKFCPDAFKIQIDIDHSEYNKMIPVDQFIEGDAKAVLDALLVEVQPGDTAEWVAKTATFRKQYPLKVSVANGLEAQYVLRTLDTLVPDDTVIVTDVGQHQMWAAQFCHVKQPNCFISSGGAGTMGYGFPAALGAQFADPKATVVAIVGDGGFQMTEAELSTAAIHKLPVKILILDNKFLGMVRQWQDLFYDKRLVGVDLEGNPDFVKLAEAYGVKAFHVDTVDNVESVLKEALAYNGG